MNHSSNKVHQRPRRILSIIAGNTIQGAGMGLGCVFLWLSTYPNGVSIRVAAMIAGYLLIYFSSHSLTHFVIGRSGGIKFTHYSVGGSAHPSTYPPIIRQIFEHLPFFAVHADPGSLRAAAAIPTALMLGSGILGTALFSSLASLFAYRAQIPGSTGLLIFNLIWQASSLIAETRKGGDLGKAARAIRKG